MADFTKNAALLDEAEDTQQKTKDAMLRIQQQTAETESLAEATLDELRAQGEQMDTIHRDMEEVSVKLDDTEKLQNRFDRWAGNWLGIMKGAAKKEAADQTAAAAAARERGATANIREVYEHESFASMGRKWKSNGLFVCEDPTKAAPDLFDPTLQGTMTDSKWQVDFSQPNIDVDGWTFADNFPTLNKTGSGTSSAGWKSYARRRKWKYIERSSTSSDTLNCIRARQGERQAGIQSKGQMSAHVGKIGYVPRSRQTDLKEAGRTYADPKKEDLDDESMAGLGRLEDNDKDINAMLDQTANSLDRLAGLAGAMKDESTSQTSKLGALDESLNKASAKQAVVNARAKRLLK